MDIFLIVSGDQNNLRSLPVTISLNFFPVLSSFKKDRGSYEDWEHNGSENYNVQGLAFWLVDGGPGSQWTQGGVLSYAWRHFPPEPSTLDFLTMSHCLKNLWGLITPRSLPAPLLRVLNPCGFEGNSLHMCLVYLL